MTEFREPTDRFG